MRAPPASNRPMIGARVFSAMSWILVIFPACASESEPPNTVKSLANTNACRPFTVPQPVTTPSPGILVFSMPKSVLRCCTKVSNSSKLPLSSRRSMRSRAVSLPRLCCASMRASPPPSLAPARRCSSLSMMSFMVRPARRIRVATHTTAPGPCGIGKAARRLICVKVRGRRAGAMQDAEKEPALCQPAAASACSPPSSPASLPWRLRLSPARSLTTRPRCAPPMPITATRCSPPTTEESRRLRQDHGRARCQAGRRWSREYRAEPAAALFRGREMGREPRSGERRAGAAPRPKSPRASSPRRTRRWKRCASGSASCAPQRPQSPIPTASTPSTTSWRACDQALMAA